MCEENLTLDRVETRTIPALKEYTGMKKRHNVDCRYGGERRREMDRIGTLT